MMDFIEDNFGTIMVILFIIIMVLCIAKGIECKKSGGVIVGGGRSPMYCVKKDAIISD